MATDDIEALYQTLTDSYAPLWEAERKVHDNALALITALVRKHKHPDSTELELLLEDSDQTPDRFVLHELVEDGEAVDINDWPSQDREWLDHAISDLDATLLGRTGSGGSIEFDF